MKKSITILLMLVTIIACVDKNPELSDEHYKKMQEDYESKKAELNYSKEAFFKENQELLIKKINLFRKLKDSTTTFENLSKDSAFYLNNVALKPINFGRSSDPDINGIKMAFLPKQGNGFSIDMFNEPYQQLYTCAADEKDDSCIQLKKEILQEFLDIKYVFIIEGHRIVEPKIDDAKKFTSGFFAAQIVAYDLLKDKPVVRFTITAANSDEIEYRKGGYFNEKPINVLKRDFEYNIEKSIWRECSLHFNLVRP